MDLHAPPASPPASFASERPVSPARCRPPPPPIPAHGCALARDILVHGRIYVSKTKVYFKSNILGFKTLVDFPLSSVVAIEPKMTALVIPNALEITVQGGEVVRPQQPKQACPNRFRALLKTPLLANPPPPPLQYSFSTLNERDQTLDLLLALWRAQAPEAFAAFTGRKSTEEAAEYRARAASLSSVRSSESAAPPAAAGAVRNVKVEKETSAGEHVAIEAKQPVSAPAAAAAASSSPASSSSSNPSAPAAGGKAAHAETEAEGVEQFEELCMDVTYPCAPKTIFDLWYRDDNFVAGLWDQLGFMGPSLAFLAIRPASRLPPPLNLARSTATARAEVDCPPFPAPEKQRDYSYVKPLKGSFGPSSTKCVFHDEIVKEDAETFFAILTVTQTPNVPSGKSFKCKSMTTFTWAAGGAGVRVRASTEVEWSGRSLIKGVVNSSSIAGQKEYNEAIEKYTREHIAAHPEIRLDGANDAAPAPAAAAATTKEVRPTQTTTRKASTTRKVGGSQPAEQPLLDQLLEDPVKLALAALVGFLLLTNGYLLLTRGGGGGSAQPASFRGPKNEVRHALDRLDRIEREWDGLRAHFGGQQPPPAVVAQPVVTQPVVERVPVQVEQVAVPVAHQHQQRRPN